MWIEYLRNNIWIPYSLGAMGLMAVMLLLINGAVNKGTPESLVLFYVFAGVLCAVSSICWLRIHCSWCPQMPCS